MVYCITHFFFFLEIFFPFSLCKTKLNICAWSSNNNKILESGICHWLFHMCFSYRQIQVNWQTKGRQAYSNLLTNSEKCVKTTQNRTKLLTKLSYLSAKINIYPSFKRYLGITYVFSNFSDQRVEGIINSHPRLGRTLNKRNSIIPEGNFDLTRFSLPVTFEC